MGKTIQTIALLLSDKKKPNLVVAPTVKSTLLIYFISHRTHKKLQVAILQWKSEIETHTNNALSVYVFHGSTRSKDISKLANYDVVLTTCKLKEVSLLF